MLTKEQQRLAMRNLAKANPIDGMQLAKLQFDQTGLYIDYHEYVQFLDMLDTLGLVQRLRRQTELPTYSIVNG